MIKEADRDGDGLISFQEFLEVVGRSNKTLAKAIHSPNILQATIRGAENSSSDRLVVVPSVPPPMQAAPPVPAAALPPAQASGLEVPAVPSDSPRTIAQLSALVASPEFITVFRPLGSAAVPPPLATHVTLDERGVPKLHFQHVRSPFSPCHAHPRRLQEAR